MTHGMSANITFIGSGIMGGLLMRRLLAAGAVEPSELMACDINEDRLLELSEHLAIPTSLDNTRGAAFADAIIVAVPPTEVIPVLEEIAEDMNEGALVVSVAPGVSISAMQDALAPHAQVARVMPNTPSEVGAGMNPYAAADDMTEEARKLLRQLLDVWGDTVEIDEDEMNAACALLAVGPTYLFPIAARLIESATEAGFPESEATAATAKLFAGVGKMMEKTGRDAGDLLDMIAMQPMDAETVCGCVAAAFEGIVGKLEQLESKLDQ